MNIARNSVIDASAQIASIMLSMIAGIFLSRWLGPEGRGEYVLVTTVANGLLANVVGLGVMPTLQVFAARERDRLAEWHTSALLISIVSGSIVAIVLLAAHQWFLGGLFKGMSFQNLQIIAFTLPLILHQNACRGLLIGLGVIVPRAVFEVSLGFFQSASMVAILLLFPSQPITELVVAYYGIMVAGTVVLIFMVSQHGRLWARPRWSTFGTLIGYGKWVYAGSIAASGRQQIDQVMANYTGGEGALGLYNQAAALAQRAGVLAQALAVASYHPISSAERPEAERLTASAFRQMLLLSIGITICGWACAPLIPYIYGREFASAVLPFCVLLPAICFVGCSRMLAIFISGHLVNPRVPLFINWASILVQFALSIILAGKWGALLGITWGFVAGNATTLILFTVAFLRRAEHAGVRDLMVIQKEDFRQWTYLIPKRLRWWNN